MDFVGVKNEDFSGACGNESVVEKTNRSLNAMILNLIERAVGRDFEVVAIGLGEQVDVAVVNDAVVVGRGRVLDLSGRELELLGLVREPKVLLECERLGEERFDAGRCAPACRR